MCNRRWPATFASLAACVCLPSALADDKPEDLDRVQKVRQTHEDSLAEPGAHAAPLYDRGDLWAKQLLDNPELRLRLELTEAQLQTLHRQRDIFIEQRKHLAAERHRLALDMARLMAQETIDEAAVFRQVEALGQVQTELAKLRMRFLLNLRKELTRDQLRRLQRETKRHFREQRMNEQPPEPATPEQEGGAQVLPRRHRFRGRGVGEHRTLWFDREPIIERD